MNIRLLGTGAADGIPGIMGTGRVSAYAIQHGGKDVRTRSAALVDGHIKMDYPPDTLCQVQRERLNGSDWTAVLFTHSHEDHFAISEIQYALYPFTEHVELPFSIYGNSTIGTMLRDRYPDWPIDIVELRSFCTYIHAEYVITPIPAYHKLDEECLNLIIQRNGKTLLYATDTGIWADGTFAFLSEYKLDCLVIECTEGFKRPDYKGHLNLTDLAVVLERLRNAGTLTGNSRVVTTHHAHTGDATHGELEEALAKLGAEPGYDGQVVHF